MLQKVMIMFKKQTKNSEYLMYFHNGFFCLFCPNMLPLKQMTEFSSILSVVALMLIYHTNR